MKLTPFIVLLFALTSFTVYAQKQDHIEYDLDESETGYTIVPLEENGLVIVSKPEKEKGGVSAYEFVKLNTELKIEKTVKFPVNNSYNLYNFTRDQNAIYFFFTKDKNSVNSSMLTKVAFLDYTIMRLDVLTMTTSKYEGTLEDPLHLTTMTAKNGIVYLAGEIGPTSKEISKVVCLSACFCWVPLLFYNPTYYPFVEVINMNKRTASKKDFSMNTYGKTRTTIVDATMDDSLNELNLLIEQKAKNLARST